MSYLTKSYQSFEDFRNFLIANDFEANVIKKRKKPKTLMTKL